MEDILKSMRINEQTGREGLTHSCYPDENYRHKPLPNDPLPNHPDGRLIEACGGIKLVEGEYRCVLDFKKTVADYDYE